MEFIYNYKDGVIKIFKMHFSQKEP